MAEGSSDNKEEKLTPEVTFSETDIADGEHYLGSSVSQNTPIMEAAPSV